MILRILILSCALFVSPLVGLSLVEFSEELEDLCFKKDEPFRINGQDNPLSNSLENFISLAEKFEFQNPGLLIKEELFFFIRNYSLDNIMLDKSGVLVWKVPATKSERLQKLWETDINVRNRILQVEDPFTVDEKCSLFHMISHGIVSIPNSNGRSYSFGNDSFPRVLRTELDPTDYYPQEIGVVGINGSEDAVALGRVLVGLYVGMGPERKKDFDSLNKILGAEPDSQLPQDSTVDLLYAVTMAEVLMLAYWQGTDRRGLSENGKWKSSPLGENGKIDGFCPMVYMLDPSANPAYSFSTVRGAADGLILGSIASSLQNKKPFTKLSQILRMYYSREGIPVEQGNAEFVDSRVTFCNRQATLEPLELSLNHQMDLYGKLVAEKPKDVNQIRIAAEQNYTGWRKQIYEISDPDLYHYCYDALPTLEKPENFPKQTLLDIFVLLDSSTTEDMFQKQQLITGYLAKKLDLRVTGSKMTILLDQRINTGSGSSAKVELKPIVIDSESSSCAACTVAQIGYENSRIQREDVIQAINQLLEERKNNETKHNGVNGKVVVYFNFESTDVQVKDVDARVIKALQEFHVNHHDVLLYAVGLNLEMLKKYARNDPSLTALAGDGTEAEVANRIYDKISFAPGILQYADCEFARSESSAVYENFVSPYAFQHWQMPPEYFYKSGKNLKITFEAKSGGAIRVCHNRATAKPENEARNCLNTSGVTGQTSSKLEFKMPNPCKSFTKETCSPFYFAVMGVNPNGANGQNGQNGYAKDYCNDINDHWCNTLDDVKFTVSHEGIRCSGSLGLAARPVAILLAVLLAYILHKKF